MLIVVAYSCFLSAYYASFQMTTNKYLLAIEWITTVSFALDIIFNCMRIYIGPDGRPVRQHSKIIKRYMVSGRFFFDVVATIPFSEILENGDSLVIVKLLRMFRLPRIVRIFSLERFQFIGNLITRN